MLLAVALAGGAAFLTLGSSGTASAQSGKRVCGNVWQQRTAVPGTDNGTTYTLRHRVYARVFEVPETDLPVCKEAQNKTSVLRLEDIKPEWLNYNFNWQRSADRWKCESFGELLGGQIGADPCVLAHLRTLDNVFQKDRTDSMLAVTWDTPEPSATMGQYPQEPPATGTGPGGPGTGAGPGGPGVGSGSRSPDVGASPGSSPTA